MLPEVSGEDAHRERAYKVYVRLISERVVQCWMLPSDTIDRVEEKLRAELGLQPNVNRGGQYGRPALQAFGKNYTAPVASYGTMKELRVKYLIYEVNGQGVNPNRARYCHYFN